MLPPVHRTEVARHAVRLVEDLAESPHDMAEVVDECGAGAYTSAFHNWDRTATVRSRPARLLKRLGPGVLPFPPEKTPTYSHPMIEEKGSEFQSQLLVHALLQYLHFTSELEDVAVIPVAMDIGRNRSGLALPDRLRRDAYSIVTDEAWHAQFSYDLRCQVVDQTGVASPPLGEPMFVKRLEELASRMRTHVPSVGRLLFTIVSETLVSSLLAEIPHDDRLPAAVRETVADHAVDEGRHHAYFRDVLRYLWKELSQAERGAIGPWLPSIVLAFLEPDYRAVATSLAWLGLGAEQIEAVLAESYPREAVMRQIVSAARPTIRYFTELGALRDPATADAFAGLTGG